MRDALDHPDGLSAPVATPRLAGLVGPSLCRPVRARAPRSQQREQAAERARTGDLWHENGLVFPTRVGTLMDKDNARRAFRSALVGLPGIDPDDWTPRDIRHSFVSLLSDSGVPLEEISRLVGHSGTSVTELVYRHQIRPVIQTGAIVMDTLFAQDTTGNDSYSPASEAVNLGRGDRI